MGNLDNKVAIVTGAGGAVSDALMRYYSHAKARR